MLESVRDLLVVAPHPDDEVIGCAGLIQHVQDHGGRATVVVMSDGAASHPGSREYPPDRLARARRAESLRALGHIGVGADCVHFMDHADGGSGEWSGFDQLESLLALPFDLVCLPSDYDNHADHRATRAICAERTRADVLHYLVWPDESGRRPPAPELSLDITPYRVRKAEALLHYATQLGSIRDSEHGFAIDQVLFQRFTAPVEHFHA